MYLPVYVDSSDVNSRLDSMGLCETHLREAVNQGYLFRTRLTAHHPRTYFGFAMWGETVAALRDQLRPEGWESSDKGNYELTSHSELGLSIAVAAGDEATGLPHTIPSNKCPKGANTVEAVDANRQIDMFSELLPTEPDDSQSLETWVLLHHIDDAEIRFELSCPSDIGEDGKIRGWKERIILMPIPLDGEPQPLKAAEGPDIDIEIRRRTA